MQAQRPGRSRIPRKAASCRSSEVRCRTQILAFALCLGAAAAAQAQEDAPAPEQGSENAQAADTIPVEPVREAPDENLGAAFPPEPEGLGATLALLAGYDNNAASASTDSQRFFFFSFQRQNREESESSLIGASGTLEYQLPLFGQTGWRNAIGAEGRRYPSAKFADTVSMNAVSQLRWTGEQYRGDAGLVFTAATFDGDRVNQAVGFSGGIERAASWAVLGLGGEIARWDFPGAPIQDVDSGILRFNLKPPLTHAGPGQVNLGLLAGLEEARAQNSPFGRNMMGANFNWTRSLGLNLGTRFNLDYLRSNYDGGISAGITERSDDQLLVGWGFEWKPRADSKWNSSVGIRGIRNQSNEPLYDYSRVLLIVQLGRAWLPEAPL